MCTIQLVKGELEQEHHKRKSLIYKSLYKVLCCTMQNPGHYVDNKQTNTRQRPEKVKGKNQNQKIRKTIEVKKYCS